MSTKTWEEELRIYIDAHFKQKKTGMNGLDREIIIDSVRNLLEEERQRAYDLGNENAAFGFKEGSRAERERIIEIVKKMGHGQDDNTTWCNMDDLLAAITNEVNL